MLAHIIPFRVYLFAFLLFLSDDTNEIDFFDWR